jgi:uncharacterized surface protein with fasciclin (FAS1) repeats
MDYLKECKDHCFSKLVAAVEKYPDLVTLLSTNASAKAPSSAPLGDADTMSTDEPAYKLTLFAPTDEAFAKAFLHPRCLKHVLLYHLSGKKLKEEDLTPGELVSTMLKLHTLGHHDRSQFFNVFGDDGKHAFDDNTLRLDGGHGPNQTETVYNLDDPFDEDVPGDQEHNVTWLNNWESDLLQQQPHHHDHPFSLKSFLKDIATEEDHDHDHDEGEGESYKKKHHKHPPPHHGQPKHDHPILVGNTRRQAAIIETDILTSNGIVHVLDTVLLPPRHLMATAILTECPSLMAFVSAVEAARLTHTLNAKKGLTLFVPSDAAFKRLGCKKLKYLFGNPLGRLVLRKILLYHVATHAKKYHGEDDYDVQRSMLPTSSSWCRPYYSKSFNATKTSKEPLVLKTLLYDKTLKISPHPCHRASNNDDDDAAAALVQGEDQEEPDLATLPREEHEEARQEGADGDVESNGTSDDDRADSPPIFVNGAARIIATDILGANGVIHVIDRLLCPFTWP